MFRKKSRMCVHSQIKCCSGCSFFCFACFVCLVINQVFWAMIGNLKNKNRNHTKLMIAMPENRKSWLFCNKELKIIGYFEKNNHQL